MFRHHTTHTIAWGPAVQGGPCRMQFLSRGTPKTRFLLWDLWELITISTEEDPTQNAISSNNNKLITLNAICTAPNNGSYESIGIMCSYIELTELATIVTFGKRTPEREQEHALQRASFGLQKSSAVLHRTC